MSAHIPFSAPDIIQTALLFGGFVAAGMQVGDQVIHFGRLKIVRKGWHPVTAVKNLRPYFVLRQRPSYGGEIGALVAARVVNAMTMRTSARGKNRSAVLAMAL
jgi:hypothetical protein